MRITTLKQLTKIVQKSGTLPLRFVVQRPCIVMNNTVMTSTAVRPIITTAATPTLPHVATTSSISTVPEESTTTINNTAVVPDSQNGLVVPVTPLPSTTTNIHSPQLTTTSIGGEELAAAPITPVSAQHIATAISPSTTSSVTSTAAQPVSSSVRSRFERLEKRIKSSLGGLNQTATNQASPANFTASYTPNSTAATVATSSVNLFASPSPNPMPSVSSQAQLCQQVSSQSENGNSESTSQLLSVTVPPTSGTTPSPTQHNHAKHSPNSNTVNAIPASTATLINSLPAITHTASASNLVEFLCNVAEAKIVS